MDYAALKVKLAEHAGKTRAEIADALSARTVDKPAVEAEPAPDATKTSVAEQLGVPALTEHDIAAAEAWPMLWFQTLPDGKVEVRSVLEPDKPTGVFVEPR